MYKNCPSKRKSWILENILGSYQFWIEKLFNPKPSSALDFCLQTRAKIIGGRIFGRKSSSVLLSVSHPLSLSKNQSSFVSSPLYSVLLSRSVCSVAAWSYKTTAKHLERKRRKSLSPGRQSHVQQGHNDNFHVQTKTLCGRPAKEPKNTRWNCLFLTWQTESVKSIKGKRVISKSNKKNRIRRERTDPSLPSP